MTEPVAVPVSYMVEVQADRTGTWAGNALRFATPVEAADYAMNLTMRWSAVREARTVPSDDAVNAQFGDNGLVHLSQEPVS